VAAVAAAEATAAAAADVQVAAAVPARIVTGELTLVYPEFDGGGCP